MTWNLPDFKRRAAAQKAEALLRRYGVEEPEHIRVEDMAEDMGIPVIEGSLSGAAARLTLLQGRAVIRVNQSDYGKPRARFSIGHELGHRELHPEKLIQVCSDTDLNAVHGSRPNEIAANIFAANLLLPAFLLGPMIRRVPVGWQFIREIAGRFNSSLQSSVIRCVELSDKPCAVVFCAPRQVKWSATSPTWRGRLIWDGPPDRRSQVARALRDGLRPEEPEDHETAEVWLDRERGLPRGVELWEHALPFSDLSGALVLLWQDGMDDDGERDDEEEDDAEDVPRF